ncbi:hypothetical protein M8J75_002300 [Diaphorina citri]|nr:hypothetical protein M8J75_002300 [Diaphorina citri]
MPLFSNKFIPKAIPPRKITKDQTQSPNQEIKFNMADPICVHLGNMKAHFHNGRWIADDSFQNNLDLREKLKVAREEINMLRIKEEILLDMVTDLTIQLEEKAKTGDKTHKP